MIVLLLDNFQFLFGFKGKRNVRWWSLEDSNFQFLFGFKVSHKGLNFPSIDADFQFLFGFKSSNSSYFSSNLMAFQFLFGFKNKPAYTAKPAELLLSIPLRIQVKKEIKGYHDIARCLSIPLRIQGYSYNCPLPSLFWPFNSSSDSSEDYQDLMRFMPETFNSSSDSSYLNFLHNFQ